MSETLPKIYLVRHGDTAWSLSGRHTGRTDIPLTRSGEEHAAQLRARLQGIRPAHIWSSPLQRARETCDLAGFGAGMQDVADLTEWDYGDYEGKTTPEIRQSRPEWQLFRDGCPNGESVAQVGTRADRLIAAVHALNADAILFGHGHMFRVIAARWLGLPPGDGALFKLAPASVSILSYEHALSERVIALWNDDRP